jgi:hypothetical protein
MVEFRGVTRLDDSPKKRVWTPTSLNSSHLWARCRELAGKQKVSAPRSDYLHNTINLGHSVT